MAPTLLSSLSNTRQLDLTISHPVQRAWVADGNLYLLTVEGVHAVPVPIKDTVMDNVMDIMEVSQSQPELKVKFDHPAVSSCVSADMSSLLVVQRVQASLVLVTVCTLGWTVSRVYNCPTLSSSTDHTVWVCSLPTHWLSPGQLLDTTAAQVQVVAAGNQAVITDGKTSCHKQLDWQTKGQFLTQFMSQTAPDLHISSLTSLASVLHQEETGELSCRFLSSSVKDLVMEKDMMALLTKEGEVWKMVRQAGQLVSRPLLSYVENITLVGEVLTAVTRDGAVYTFNMRQQEQLIGQVKVGSLKVKSKGEILKQIVEESKNIETIGRATADMKECLQQLQIFQQLLLGDSAKLFETEVCVAAVDIFSAETCLKVIFKNISDFKLIGKFWCLKLDILLHEEKCTQSKTFPLPSSFSGQDTISCVLPLPDTAPEQFPLIVKSHLVLRGHLLGHRGDGGLVPSLTLVNSKVTVIDVLRMSGVGLGDRRVETDKEKFYRSLGGEGCLQGRGEGAVGDIN